MGNTFFIGWELWQQMTLVLACSIILVFALGLAKLWRANRLIQRLELEDAEKKARRFDYQHCGVDYLRVDDIPFGVRAIQRGVEVEGIWISHIDTPDLSQVPSSATLIGDQTELSKFKATVPDFHAPCRVRSLSESGHSGIGKLGDTTLGCSSPRQPSSCSKHQSVTQLCVGPQSIGSQSRISAQRIASYVPRGARMDLEPAHEEQREAKSLKEKEYLVENHSVINKTKGYGI